MTFGRAALGPVMVALAATRTPGYWLVGILWAAIVSDVFDGIAARRLGVATPTVRRLDSLADLVFWVCALEALYLRRPTVLERHWVLVVAMLALEAAVYAISFVRFHQPQATHAYSAKAWGLMLVGAMTAMLGWGEERFSLPILFGGYVVCWLDVAAILLILPKWATDVPSCYHAWLLRRGVAFKKNPLFHS
jgi:CDP-diacylglycerol--glycerol-3-phosphate 3-phosphatidyltransferase